MNTVLAQDTVFERASRLSWLHWTVIASALVLTIVGAYSARSVAKANADAHFEHAIERVTEQVRFRMAKYETAMRAAVAAIHAMPEPPNRQQWKRFADRLAIDVNYPGIEGIGLILAAPVESAEVEAPRLPVVFLEPEARNAAMIGQDMAQDPILRDAARRAIEKRRTQITAPAQWPGMQDDEWGFLLFAPFFNSDMNASWGATEDSFLGFVYAPFRFRDLLVGALGRDSREVAVRLIDNNQVMFDEFAQGDATGRQRATRTLATFGRNWMFEFESDDYHPSNVVSTAILVAGLGIDGCLLFMFLGMARANRKATGHIRAANAAHRNLHRALAVANSDLSEFAHAVTRELRAPLRGIVGLTEWIREDITSIRDAQTVEQLVPALEHVNTIARRAGRLDTLITGVLAYSEVGAQPQNTEILTVSSLREAITESIPLPPGQPSFSTAMETLCIDRSRIVQVLRELLDNCVRHHDSAKPLVVSLQISEDDHHYLFSLEDNGPGIDAGQIDKAFESFKSHLPAEDTRMSGLGLALARKITESVGGDINVSSVRHSGTRVHIRWPKPSLIHPEVVAA